MEAIFSIIKIQYNSFFIFFFLFSHWMVLDTMKHEVYFKKLLLRHFKIISMKCSIAIRMKFGTDENEGLLWLKKHISSLHMCIFPFIKPNLFWNSVSWLNSDSVYLVWFSQFEFPQPFHKLVFNLYYIIWCSDYFRCVSKSHCT